MDIKDFILIGGGILIVMVIAHGFWIAYRSRREPYRLDIARDISFTDVDDIERLRGELPNGGARVVGDPSQASLDLGIPEDEALLVPRADPVVEPETRPPAQASRVASEPFVDSAEGEAETPELSTASAATDTETDAQARTEDNGELRTESRAQTPSRARVRDIQLVSTPKRRADAEPTPEPADEQPRELLVVNLLAQNGRRFAGEDLVNALRSQGLRYGDMNIFHRIDPATKAKLYSVANILEPGTFDLSDLDALRSPGMSFFMRLPGPEQPMQAFDDMIKAARQISVQLGGELRDEQMSVLTGQTREHMRQRIADFARRRLSLRA